MSETITQEVAIIPVEDFKALAEAAPVALQKNTALLEKAKIESNKIRTILQERPIDDEVFEILKEYRAKLPKGKEVSYARRSEFTRFLTRISKLFTSQEAWYDEEEAFVKKIMDDYATQLLRAQRERERKAELELQKSKERIEIKSKLEADHENFHSGQISKMRNKLFYEFDRVTLENYDKAVAHFTTLKFSYTEQDYNLWSSFIGSRILTPDEILEIEREVRKGKFEKFQERFINECTLSLQDIIDKLPGKKKELDEIAAAKGKEAERLKAEAESRAKIEAENRAKAEAEAQEKAQAEAAAKKDVAIAETLFDHESNLATVSPEAPKGREGYEITVNAPPGIMLIFTLWYQHEGKTMTVDQILKRKWIQWFPSARNML